MLALNFAPSAPSGLVEIGADAAANVGRRTATGAQCALTRMARQRSARGPGSTGKSGASWVDPSARLAPSSRELPPQVSPNRVSRCKGWRGRRRDQWRQPRGCGRDLQSAAAHAAVGRSGARVKVLQSHGGAACGAQYLPSTPSLQQACGPNRMLSRATNVCMCRLPISALNGPPGAVPPVNPVKRSSEKPM